MLRPGEGGAILAAALAAVAVTARAAAGAAAFARRGEPEAVPSEAVPGD